MKQVVFFFLLSLLCLSNCVYFRMTHLSKDDLGWVQCYSRNPSPKFVSNRGQTSSLSYDRVNIANSTNRFYFSANGSYKYEACASYDLNVHQANTTFSGWFSIKKYVDDDSLWTSFELNRFCSDEIRNYGYIPLKKCDFEMDSVIYHNCVIADSTNAIYIPHLVDTVKIRIDKFVISKKYGLIYYRFDNGEEFKRIFKHKPAKKDYEAD
ncbi:MAG: hypothetical protein K2H08_04210 [Duncaniella sp.]|nr:hypothetical protein [Duncaniella sp.]